MGEIILSLIILAVGLLQLGACFSDDGRRYLAERLFWWKKATSVNEKRAAAVFAFIGGILALLFGLSNLLRLIR